MNAPAEKRDLALSRFRLAGWIVTLLAVPLILLPSALAAAMPRGWATGLYQRQRSI
jgi:hypothetical protein